MGVTLCLKIKNNSKYENHKLAWNQVECNEFGICLGEEEGSEGGNGGDNMRSREHFVSVISLKVHYFHPSPRNHSYVSTQLFYQQQRVKAEKIHPFINTWVEITCSEET